MKESLKVHGLRDLPVEALGKPLSILINLIDNQDDIYESEIVMQEGWNLKGLEEAFYQSMKLAGGVNVREVIVKNVKYKKAC